MSEINPINITNQQKPLNVSNESDINIENMDSIFATAAREKIRTTFDKTFFELPLDSKIATQGKKFYQGLIDNKESLCQDLGLTSEEYDALSCIALTLASQETGMGLEDYYISENNGSIVDVGRDIAKEIFSDSSVSSGLTQMKIYDFMYSPFIDADTKAMFEKYGVEAYSKTEDNLFYNPDKSAAATIILLSDIASKNYKTYIDILSNSHEKIRENLDPDLSDEECLNKGLDILSSLQDVFDNLPEFKKDNFRNAFKDWFMSYNGFQNTKEYRKEHPEQNKRKYFEDENLKKFNKMLNKSGIELKQQDLDYIRYALSADGAQMNNIEYCIYAWNKGTGGSGYQLDRMLAEKLGEFFPSNKLDFDLYTYNTETMLEKYAQKAGVDIDTINYILDNYANRK